MSVHCNVDFGTIKFYGSVENVYVSESFKGFSPVYPRLTVYPSYKKVQTLKESHVILNIFGLIHCQNSKLGLKFHHQPLEALKFHHQSLKYLKFHHQSSNGLKVDHQSLKLRLKFHHQSAKKVKFHHQSSKGLKFHSHKSHISWLKLFEFIYSYVVLTGCLVKVVYNFRILL